VNKAVVLFCLLAGLYGCGGGDAGQKEVKEFEGVITYRISYKNKDYKPIFGDTLRVFYSKGNVAKVYNSQGPDAMRKEVFYGESRRYVVKMAMSDTVFIYDMGNTGHLSNIRTIRVADDTRILGHVCKKIEFDDKYTVGSGIYVYTSFWYASDVLKVDNRYFKDWALGHFNTFINEEGVFYLKCEASYRLDESSDLITKTFTAVNIKEQKVDPSVFYVDTAITKPLPL
jgi:hypothetical protein